MRSPRRYSLVLLPDDPDRPARRVRLRLSVIVVALLCSSGTSGYFISQHLRADAEARSLVEENVRLREGLAALESRVQRMTRSVDRIERLNARLSRITELSDPERGLAMGPVGSPVPAASTTGVGLSVDLAGPNPERRALGLVEARAEVLEAQAHDLEPQVRRLHLYLEARHALLSETPSRMPTNGWITSYFGFRLDPYTGLNDMHPGLDISASIGTPVLTSADGVVIFAGRQDDFGNVVKVDHGHGLLTIYAHLSAIRVEDGAEVKRGQRVGDVGNTGRSTGPHLHYEVRLNGIPQNPQRFILE
ncbi:MAG: M23 family metallopeptidase [Deltaproteobacteria bacterium]|nr:M23 family metallopeptidase [Deltaproteobacteria bacterium]